MPKVRVISGGFYGAGGKELLIGEEFEIKGDLDPALSHKLEVVKGGKSTKAAETTETDETAAKGKPGRPKKDATPALPGMNADAPKSLDDWRDEAKAAGVEVDFNMTAEDLEKAIAEKKAG